jgi:hypothetical protein
VLGVNPTGADVSIESMTQEHQPLEGVLDIRSGVKQTTTVLPASPRPVSTGWTVEPWVIDLRARLVDAGADLGRVDDLITSNIARFRSSKFRQFVPLLVERSVQRALRGD